MKNSSTIRSLLLISQVDMARLLNVHRSQLSMFELGKRDLPREAKILLAPMLVHVSKASMRLAAEADYPDPEKHEYLKELVEDNNFARLRMDRKLEKTRNNYQKKQAILHLTTFLSKSAVHQPESYKELVESIRDRANRMYGGCDAATVMHCEIQSELIELERLLLEEYITKNTNAGDVKQ